MKSSSNETEVEEVNDLLRNLVYRLVDDKDAVSIDIDVRRQLVVVEINVAPHEVGKVLGRSGGYAVYLRRLFKGIYGKLGKRLTLQVVDPSRE